MMMIIDVLKRSLSLLPVDLVSHDVVEIVISHETIVVKVSTGEHVFNLSISKVLADIMSNPLEFDGADLTLSQIIITALLTS